VLLQFKQSFQYHYAAEHLMMQSCKHIIMSNIHAVNVNVAC